MSEQMKVKKEFVKNDDKVFQITTIEPINYRYGDNYSFNVGFAQKFGINEAIMLNNIIFWTKTNKANDNNLYDGYYWTYNSAKAFKKLFPFWTERQIRYTLDSLEKQKVIKSGNYNKKGYDQTKWYAIIDESMLHFCNMEVTNLEHGVDKNVTPIPYVNPIINSIVNNISTPKGVLTPHTYSSEYFNISPEENSMLIEKFSGLSNIYKEYELLYSFLKKEKNAYIRKNVIKSNDYLINFLIEKWLPNALAFEEKKKIPVFTSEYLKVSQSEHEFLIKQKKYSDSELKVLYAEISDHLRKDEEKLKKVKKEKPKISVLIDSWLEYKEKLSP